MLVLKLRQQPIAIGQSGEGSPKVIASGVNSIAIGMQLQLVNLLSLKVLVRRRQIWRCIRSSKANAEATTALGNAAEANIAN